MIDHTRSDSPCEHCGTYEIYNHCTDCPTVPIEEKARRYKEAYERRGKELQREREHAGKWHKEVTLWQGKFRIVAWENNKLRKKLKREAEPAK